MYPVSDCVLVVEREPGPIVKHIILQLLAAGYRVRTVVSGPPEEQKLRMFIEYFLKSMQQRLHVFVAKTSRDSIWRDAAMGCSYVIHCKAPMPRKGAKSPLARQSMIASELRSCTEVIEAANDAGVRKYVMMFPETEENVTCGLGKGRFTSTSHITDKTSYSQVCPVKHIFDSFKTGRSGTRLTVITFAGVIGPWLGSDCSSTIRIVDEILNGDKILIPSCFIRLVDVRDLANLAIRAMRNAVDEQFVATAEGVPITLAQIAALTECHRATKKPSFSKYHVERMLIRSSAIAHRGRKSKTPDTDLIEDLKITKAKDLLGWKPRSIEQSIKDVLGCTYCNNECVMHSW